MLQLALYFIEIGPVVALLCPLKVRGTEASASFSALGSLPNGGVIPSDVDFDLSLRLSSINSAYASSGQHSIIY